MTTPFFTAVGAIIAKDLRAETRSRDVVTVMALFALLSVLVFSFALELDRAAREEAVSGVLWVTLVFASLLGFNRSLALEQDRGNIEVMLLAPISRSAIFAGKLAGNCLFTLMVGVVLLPLMTALYNMNMLAPPLVVTTALGIFGFSTIGTLLATLAGQTRSREALLPIALLPVALPFLLTAVKASKSILADAPQTEWLPWLQMMAGITVIYFALCWLLYGFVLEE